MIISPIVRGLFGLEWNVAQHDLSVTPSLPPAWNNARLSNIPFGNQRVSLSIQRDDSSLIIRATGDAASSVELHSRAAGAAFSRGELRIPLPPVEVGVDEGLPQPGSATAQMKVLDQQFTPRSLTVRLSAPAGSSHTILLRINSPRLHARHSQLRAIGVELPANLAPQQSLQVKFAGNHANNNKYVEQEITFHW
jgi:hypothetical protein